MTKKALLNSVVALFFLYTISVIDKERLMYKRKYERLLSKKEYDAAFEDMYRAIKSLIAEKNDRKTDDTTRYS